MDKWYHSLMAWIGANQVTLINLMVLAVGLCILIAIAIGVWKWLVRPLIFQVMILWLAASAYVQHQREMRRMDRQRETELMKSMLERTQRMIEEAREAEGMSEDEVDHWVKKFSYVSGFQGMVSKHRLKFLKMRLWFARKTRTDAERKPAPIPEPAAGSKSKGLQITKLKPKAVM